MNLSALAFFVAGIGLLVAGGELLVRGASRMAAAFGLSPLLIGLTVVAFGTSSPELAASVASAMGGRGDIALGNVVGSNIFNVLFILGACALVSPLVVAIKLVRVDVPLMVGVSLLLYGISLDGRIGRGDGIGLLLGLAVYVVVSYRMARRESAAVLALSSERKAPTPPSRGRATALNVGMIAAGLLILMLGARWMVEGAVTVARSFGVSELVIGLTIVAAGTSLPEVATSILATIRGERDIAVGNVVGSNIFNILGVLGASSLATAQGLPVSPVAMALDVPVMVAVAFACLPVFLSGHMIARWEGGVFLLYYVAYTGYLVLDSSGHDMLPLYSSVMLGFVVPITLLTLGIVGLRAWRAGHSPIEGSK